jgi:hypothetical protein
LVSAELRRDRPGIVWPAVLAPLLLAASTSFVVWTTSGLENPLLALLAALSCTLVARSTGADRRLDAAAGATAALLALTRPDGVLYAAAFPLVLVSSPEAWRTGLRGLAGRLAAHAAGFLPLLGGYLLFRHAYFGEWVPNTYYAKEKPSLAFLLDAQKWRDLLEAAAGSVALPAVALLAGGALLLLYRRRLDLRQRSLAVHLSLAALGYMVMPLDWMGEYRFATAFFLFFYWALAETIAMLWTAEGLEPRASAVAFALALAAGSAMTHAPRSAAFLSGPIVPFAAVAEFYGNGFNHLAEQLPVPRPSLLAPDVGGTLYYSRLRVYDLVGLCDRTTARTLTTDTAAFHHYVLEDVRPTFIHVHGPWAGWAAFHQSERFKQDYVAIRETWGPPETAEGGAVPEPKWGDYVRRDALGSRLDAALAALQQAYAAAGMSRFQDL